MKRLFIIGAILLTSAMQMLAGGQRLFHVSRNLNKNIVVYDANIVNGNLNASEPIHAYWYNNEARPGETYELSYVQKALAYGYSVLKSSQSEASVRLKAYKKRDLRVCKKNGKWVALVTINGKECILNEIYAHCKNKTSVLYVELRGTALQGGTKEKEIVKQ